MAADSVWDGDISSLDESQRDLLTGGGLSKRFSNLPLWLSHPSNIGAFYGFLVSLALILPYAMTEEFWQLLLNVNLIGPFRCAHAAADALKQSKGAIVNTASIAGVGKQGSSIVYSATKTGLVSLTRSLARALAPEVRVNAVAPGQVKTPWTENWPEERKQLARDQSVLKRRCSPEEIAFGMLYLCAGNTMVTGHTLVIDGGMTL